MASTIRDIVIYHHLIVNDGLVELDKLRELASEEISYAADNNNIYLSDCLDNLDLYRAWEADPADVRQYLRDEDLGDWRQVTRSAAILATQSALEEAVERDLALLAAALEESSAEGYRAVALSADCPHGWCPHQRECDWSSGTLFEWSRIDGTDAQCLRVDLSDGDSSLWLDLMPSE